MYNRIILVGNLTRDPELRYMPNGGAVCTTGIATNRKYKKQDGSQGEEVCFVDITFFGRTAEVANQYLRKGKKILVEGRLKLDQWTDQNGGKRSKHSVTVDSMQMLDSKGSNDGGYNNQQSTQPSGNYNNPNSGVNQQQDNYKKPAVQQSDNIPDIDIDEDEIPF
jgi:single-strand DNA-binding protein